MPRKSPNFKHTQRRAKGKGSADPRNLGRRTGLDSQPFLFTKEVGTPKASFNWGNEPSATPIKIFFSLLKAGKLKASWKKAKGKLKASERQAKNKLK